LYSFCVDSSSDAADVDADDAVDDAVALWTHFVFFLEILFGEYLSTKKNEGIFYTNLRQEKASYFKMVPFQFS
jgi:hypothetical protein